MLEINFVDERILSNNFEELEKSMFSDLGERKENFYEYMVEYPTNKSRKNFVKEVSKGYKVTSEEEKSKNLHKFKMKERGELDEIGNFRDYYSNIKTYILSIYDEERKGGLIIKDFGAARKSEEIIYWNNNISIF
jgi:ClpP class serine protease